MRWRQWRHWKEPLLPTSCHLSLLHSLRLCSLDQHAYLGLLAFPEGSQSLVPIALDWPRPVRCDQGRYLGLSAHMKFMAMCHTCFDNTVFQETLLPILFSLPIQPIWFSQCFPPLPSPPKPMASGPFLHPCLSLFLLGMPSCLSYSTFDFQSHPAFSSPFKFFSVLQAWKNPDRCINQYCKIESGKDQGRLCGNWLTKEGF